MPRPKKTDWHRVTITLSDKCLDALHKLNGLTGKEMGEIADEAMRQGGLFANLSETLNYTLGKTDTLPQGLSAKDIKSHAYAMPEPPAAPPASPILPNAKSAVPAPGTPQETTKLKRRGRFGMGDEALFQRVEAALAAGRIRQKDLMEEVAPGVNSASYRSVWRASGHVPAQYCDAVRAVLARIEQSEIATPAAVKAAAAKAIEKHGEVFKALANER